MMHHTQVSFDAEQQQADEITILAAIAGLAAFALR
jgi:hypothetical protein